MSTKLYLMGFLLAAVLLTANAQPSVKCMQPHPRGYGPCEMLLFGYYYNQETRQCAQWSEGGCGTRGGHSFLSIEECQRECLR